MRNEFQILPWNRDPNPDSCLAPLKQREFPSWLKNADYMVHGSLMGVDSEYIMNIKYLPINSSKSVINLCSITHFYLRLIPWPFVMAAGLSHWNWCNTFPCRHSSFFLFFCQPSILRRGNRRPRRLCPRRLPPQQHGRVPGAPANELHRRRDVLDRRRRRQCQRRKPQGVTSSVGLKAAESV